jgi:hypothetical protein
MSESSDLISRASTNAILLSYASQDAEVARRICQALRCADGEPGEGTGNGQ